MSKILIKGIVLDGIYNTPVYKYREPPPVPMDSDVEKTYKSIDELLKTNGQPIIPQKVQHLPFIEEGFDTPSVAASCYIFNDCIVANGFRPYFDGVAHIIQVAAKLKNKSKIDDTFKVLKERAGWEWQKYWREYRKSKTVNITEKLENITRLIPHIPKLLTD